MYRCCHCKNYFDYPDTHEWYESRGEYWGMPCSEHMIEEVCPYCGSDDIEESEEEENEDE